MPRLVARRRRKHTKGVATKSKRARTRTSLIGMTIYQPDLEPSARGRRLLDALNGAESKSGSRLLLQHLSVPIPLPTDFNAPSSAARELAGSELSCHGTAIRLA